MKHSRLLSRFGLALVFGLLFFGCGNEPPQPLGSNGQALTQDELAQFTDESVSRVPTYKLPTTFNANGNPVVEIHRISQAPISKFKTNLAAKGNLGTLPGDQTKVFYLHVKLYNNSGETQVGGRIDVSHGRLDLASMTNIGDGDTVTYLDAENAVSWTLAKSTEEKELSIRINLAHTNMLPRDVRVQLAHAGEIFSLSLNALPAISTQVLVKQNVHVALSGFNLRASDCPMGAISGQVYLQGNLTLFKGVWSDPSSASSQEVHLVAYTNGNGQAVVNGQCSTGKYTSGIVLSGEMMTSSTFYGIYTNAMLVDHGFFDGVLLPSLKDPNTSYFRGNWQQECFAAK